LYGNRVYRDLAQITDTKRARTVLSHQGCEAYVGRAVTNPTD